MADDQEEEEGGSQKQFFADRAKTGRAKCQKCKELLKAGELRLAKAGYNPFGPGPRMMWHHVECLFDVFKRQRATTAKIESPDDIEGWDLLEDEDQEKILEFLPDGKGTVKTKEPAASKGTPTKASTGQKQAPTKASTTKEHKSVSKENREHKHNSFRQFRKLCAQVGEISGYKEKTEAIRQMLTKGPDSDDFKGDHQLWLKFLLPMVQKRIYNLQSKQLVKLFSRIFKTDQNEMLTDLENGDVAETIGKFFVQSKFVMPAKKSTISVYDVDEFLDELSSLSKEDEQEHHFRKFALKCTDNDLKMVIRLIKHDIKINAGPKHVLEALHPDAYDAFRMSRDLKTVVSKALGKSGPSVKETTLVVTLAVMTPVLPMLAEPCKTIDQALTKCPNGMLSEVKYDGERVQIHKQGNVFKYFSRSLKAVVEHKVAHLKSMIPKAFPEGDNLILDSEILMIDLKTGNPLPFGTLGIHKKAEFKDACVCLFVFDCLYYNGDVLINNSLHERRKILQKIMNEVPNRVVLSEFEEIHDRKKLIKMINKVFKLGLEGLILKDLKSCYEPGKRHWLKLKKDSLKEGVMCDSADLVVLGAWFGTGRFGGKKSVFLMGCLNRNTNKWCTVTKVHGLTDEDIENLQEEFKDMVKIQKDSAKVPSWLNCTSTMVPDFIAQDPKKMPVWEITGAEFTQHNVHTADGISIRFPRVVKFRPDKDWDTATDLEYLKVIFENSKDTSNFNFIDPESAESISSTKKKPKLDTDKLSSSPSSKMLKTQTTSAKKEELKGDNYGSPPKKFKQEKLENYTSKKTEKDVSECLLSKRAPKQVLPDLLEGKKFVISPSVSNGDTLKRYIIAYGGIVLPEDDAESATHILHGHKKVKNTILQKYSPTISHVRSSWILDSIKLHDLQNAKLYKVFCDTK